MRLHARFSRPNLHDGGKGLRSPESLWVNLKVGEFGLSSLGRVGCDTGLVFLDSWLFAVYICWETGRFVQRQRFSHDDSRCASGLCTRRFAGCSVASCEQCTVVLDGFERYRWVGYR